MEKLTPAQIMENALREIAAHASHKGGEWASDQAFETLAFIDRPVAAAAK